MKTIQEIEVLLKGMDIETTYFQPALSELLNEREESCMEMTMNILNSSVSAETVLLALHQLRRAMLLHSAKLNNVEPLHVTLQKVIRTWNGKEDVVSIKIAHDAASLAATLCWMSFSQRKGNSTFREEHWKQMISQIPSVYDASALIYYVELINVFSCHSRKLVDLNGETKMFYLYSLHVEFEQRVLLPLFHYAILCMKHGDRNVLLFIYALLSIDDENADSECYSTQSVCIPKPIFLTIIQHAMEERLCFPKEALDVLCAVAKYRHSNTDDRIAIQTALLDCVEHVLPMGAVSCRYVFLLFGQFMNFSNSAFQKWISNARNVSLLLAFSISQMVPSSHSPYYILGAWSFVSPVTVIDRTPLVFAYLSMRIEHAHEDENVFCAEERFVEEMSYLAGIIRTSDSSLLESILRIVPNGDRQQMWLLLVLVAVWDVSSSRDNIQNASIDTALTNYLLDILHLSLSSPLSISLFMQCALLSLVEAFDAQYFQGRGIRRLPPRFAKEQDAVLFIFGITLFLLTFLHPVLVDRAVALLMKICIRPHQNNYNTDDAFMEKMLVVRDRVFQHASRKTRISFYTLFASIMNFKQIQRLLQPLSTSVVNDNGIAELLGIFRGIINSRNPIGIKKAKKIVYDIALSRIFPSPILSSSSIQLLCDLILQSSTTEHAVPLFRVSVSFFRRFLTHCCSTEGERQKSHRLFLRLWSTVFGRGFISGPSMVGFRGALIAYDGNAYYEALRMLLFFLPQLDRRDPKIVPLYYEALKSYVQLDKSLSFAQSAGEVPLILDLLASGLNHENGSFSSRCNNAICKIAKKTAKSADPHRTLQMLELLPMLQQRMIYKMEKKEEDWYARCESLYVVWSLAPEKQMETNVANNVVRRWFQDMALFVRSKTSFSEMIRCLSVVDTNEELCWKFTKLPDLSELLAPLKL